MDINLVLRRAPFIQEVPQYTFQLVGINNKSKSLDKPNNLHCPHDYRYIILTDKESKSLGEFPRQYAVFLIKDTKQDNHQSYDVNVTRRVFYDVKD